MSAIEVDRISKSFGRTEVLRGVDLDVPDRSITAILGPSGSGKTTLLRLLAGFDRVDAGSISVSGRVVDDGGTWCPAQRRGVGYVPQEGSLFGHLSVRANVSFGVRRGHRDTRFLDGLLEMVGLAELGDRYPHQLSGGQQQRVALARALAIRPAVVLLDEPFSSLDASLRAVLRRDVVAILAETGTAAVLVTHDQDEALSVADRVALLDEGRIEQIATPDELYRNPVDIRSARFVGEANVLPAVVRAGAADSVLGPVPLRGTAAGDGDHITVLVRPEQVRIDLNPDAQGVAAVVDETVYHGHDTLVRLRAGTVDSADGAGILARVSGEHSLTRGQSVRLQVSGSVLGWPSGGATD